MFRESGEMAEQSFTGFSMPAANLISLSMSSSLSPISSRRILQHAASHCSNVLCPTSYSARGSLFSSLTLGSSEGVVLATSGVVAHTWPGWATVMAIKRLRLHWIILVENNLYSVVDLNV